MSKTVFVPSIKETVSSCTFRGGPDGQAEVRAKRGQDLSHYTGPGSRRVMGAFEDSFRDKFIDPTKEWLKDEMKPYEKGASPGRRIPGSSDGAGGC